MGRVLADLSRSCFCCNSFQTPSWLQTSTCTKNLYYVIFFIGNLLLWIASEIPDATTNFPFCQGDNSTVCSKFSSFVEVYRVAFSFAVFFAFMCVATFGVTSSRDTRAVIHNGFWFYKLVFIGTMLFVSTLIPYGWFDVVLMYIGLVFLVSFNTFEVILYSQLSKDIWHACLLIFWRNRSHFCKFFLIFFMISLYCSGLAIGVFLFIFYKSCTINLVVIIINLSLSYVISIMSITSKFYRGQKYAVLSSSIFTTHVMIITWSGVTNNPWDECNPTEFAALVSFKVSNFLRIICVGLAIFLALEYFFRIEKREQPNAVIYVEERGKEICGVWGKTKVVETVQPRDTDVPPRGAIYTTTDPNDDEYESLKYTWFGAHDIFMQGTLYFMLCFTDFYKFNWEDTGKTPIFYNQVAMWFKFSSCWICLICFLLLDLFSERQPF